MVSVGEGKRGEELDTHAFYHNAVYACSAQNGIMKRSNCQ